MILHWKNTLPILKLHHRGGEVDEVDEVDEVGAVEEGAVVEEGAEEAVVEEVAVEVAVEVEILGVGAEAEEEEEAGGGRGVREKATPEARVVVVAEGVVPVERARH